MSNEPELIGAMSHTNHRQHTWIPILLGVLCGMVVFVLLAMLERPAFYRLTVWIFNETSPKALFVMPGYYWVHRTILLTLAATGGLIGLLFSRWHKRTSFLFLLGTLLVIALIATLGFH